MTGRLFAMVGPSGVGKDTVLAGLCGAGGPHWVRRVITRPESAGGEPFEGVSEHEFTAYQALGRFALVWRAHGLSYGIPHQELAPLRTGRDVMFNGSRAALHLAARTFSDLVVIHVTASPEVLARRLHGRGRESAAQIAARLARDTGKIPAGLRVIELVNDTMPEDAVAQLRAALGYAPAPDKAAR